MSLWDRKPSLWILVMFGLIVATFFLVESKVRRSSPVSGVPERSRSKSTRRIITSERRGERAASAPFSARESIVRRGDGSVRQAFAVKPGLVCMTDPLGGIPVIESPSVDEVLYIRDEYHDQTNRRDWYLIGRIGGEPIGWARPADLIEWPSRYAFEPDRGGTPADSEPVVLAGEIECLAALRSSRACLKHGGNCPNETILGEYLTAGKGGAVAPIVDAGLIEIKSNEREYAYRILVYPYIKPPPPRREGDRVQEILSNVYLVLIVTPSLWSAAERESTLGLIDSLERELNARFGGFRFHIAMEIAGGAKSGADERPLGIVDFIDAKAFRDRARRMLKIADAFGGTYADAIEAALPSIDASKDHKLHLSWPDERSSRPLCKMIVTIGPGRGESFDRRQILKDVFISKHREISFKSIPFADSKPLISRADFDLDLGSRRGLSEQGHRNPRTLAEGLRRIPPRFDPVATPRELSGRFWEILAEELDWTNDLIDLVRAEDSGNIRDYVQKQGLSPMMVSVLLTRCRVAAGPSPVAKAARSTGTRAPAWKVGWIDRSTVLRRRLSVAIPLSIAEIDRLSDRLKRLVDSTLDERAIAREYERIATAIVHGEILFLKENSEQSVAIAEPSGNRSRANDRRRKTLREPIESLAAAEDRSRSSKESIRRALEAIQAARQIREADEPSSIFKINEMSIIDFKNLKF